MSQTQIVAIAKHWASLNALYIPGNQVHYTHNVLLTAAVIWNCTKASHSLVAKHNSLSSIRSLVVKDGIEPINLANIKFKQMYTCNSCIYQRVYRERERMSSEFDCKVRELSRIKG